MNSLCVRTRGHHQTCADATSPVTCCSNLARLGRRAVFWPDTADPPRNVAPPQPLCVALSLAASSRFSRCASSDAASLGQNGADVAGVVPFADRRAQSSLPALTGRDASRRVPFDKLHEEAIGRRLGSRRKRCHFRSPTSLTFRSGPVRTWRRRGPTTSRHSRRWPTV